MPVVLAHDIIQISCNCQEKQKKHLNNNSKKQTELWHTDEWKVILYFITRCLLKTNLIAMDIKLEVKSTNYINV